ncbi:MAG: thiamine-phosphate kinase [Gammaproteobacteria bacterium]|nr:MAG: thiamine-phosphate kinase [Gammaproteobacteria bacterium]
MAASEFEIIRRFFTPPGPGRNDVLAGVGDDAALLAVPPDSELVVCMDTLVAGVHFPKETAPAAIGYKALAVNLSDLAAMGAEPAWTTLSVTLPDNDMDWLEQFSRGFFGLASRYNVQLVGGDITRGPLNITVQAHGFVPAGQALYRQGARPGDLVCVTGSLGDAGLALHLGLTGEAPLRKRLDYPQPRIEAGIALRQYASAMIDISDGLLADLDHLLEADGLGALLRVDELPRSADFLSALDAAGPGCESLARDLTLSAGDDYELCFCIPELQRVAMEETLASIPCAVTAVGVIEEEPGIRCYRKDGSTYTPSTTGYQHFNRTD